MGRKLLKYSFLRILSLLAFLCIFSPKLHAQIIAGNGYLMGSLVEVGISGAAGHEGTLDIPGSHARGGDPAVPFGFVANPMMDLWTVYDGDFFTAGSPENGFGLEINGTNYSNNGWNHLTTSPLLQEIPQAPGTSINYYVDGECMTVEWEGLVSNVRINVKYHLSTPNLFYSTEVTLTNEGATPLTDLYYYRNVDPDNNQSIGGTFTTTNTIESQPDVDCIKALVSATQSSPHPSYLGLGALGDKFRVSHGGFSNRSGSDIWNATGGLEGTEGVSDTDDASISLAYKTDLAPGESESFTFTVVLTGDAVEAAIASLYYITYETGLGASGGGATNACNPSTVVVESCLGTWVEVAINGPDVDDYDWTWSDGTMNDTAIFEPEGSTLITVTGTPVSPCLTGIIIKDIIVDLSLGPQIFALDTHLICGLFNLDSLEWGSTGTPAATSCVFLTEQPDSADQVDPAFPGPWVGPGDEVWILCSDDVSGCYNYRELTFDFLGPGSAGPDTLDTLCAGAGSLVSLINYIPDTVNQQGYFIQFDPPGSGIDSTGVFSAVGYEGSYSFYYITPSRDSCESDTAVISIYFEPAPFADFEYEVDGNSSAAGLTSVCYLSTIDFFNASMVTPPATIISYAWDFGDGTTSTLENPSHMYTGPGLYPVTLFIESTNGCVHGTAKALEVYENPPYEIVFTSPVCHDDNNGVIDLTPEIPEPFTITITDELGVPQIDTLLTDGTYYIVLEDNVGCMSFDTVTLINPPFMDIFYHLSPPACAGDSGWAKVDSVVGESFNNPVYYQWNPDPAEVSDYGADSSYWMGPGDYTLTVTDDDGCTNSISFTFLDPPPFYLTDLGWDTAYCRQYGFQSGNGVVWAAAAGGIPPINYEWTYLVDGSTGTSSTWGGRSGGNHVVNITDGNGCVLTEYVYVDSVNPIAAFSVLSEQLDEFCVGTAPVEVEFVNNSKYFANPNNPLADTTFFWDLDYMVDEDDWIISHSYFDRPDTTYEAEGDSYAIDVCLIAFNKNGCSDTACKKIVLWEPPEINPVNVFTPDGGGENDIFTFRHYAKGINLFHCIIVDRWGVQVGEFHHIEDGWDGLHYKNGKPCPDGVYYWTYTATADNGQEFEGHGVVTLIGSDWD
ncbi:MAG: PKD domain-containing protein [Crocinitomicaceae bacterium]|nr:PKD domain-containing protein [Crocinitomicaceae bacterium]